MRVFIPDCAFQAQVPKDQRQYLGNWSSTEVADVYTRDKRNVVSSSWLKVCSQMSWLTVNGTRLARVDLSHPDFDTEKQVEPPGTPGPRAALTWDSPAKPGSFETPVASSTSSSPWSEVDGSQSSTKKARCSGPEPSIRRCDMVDSPLGPLSIVCRNISNTGGTSMVHLFTPDSNGVGCGWSPSMDKVRFLGFDDYCQEQGFLSLCAKRFKYFLLPAEREA